MHLSTAQVNQLREKAVSLQGSIQRMRAKAEDAKADVMAIAEVGGAAFTMGVVEGKYGGAEFWGLPASLWTALATHGLGFAGYAEEHMHNIGNGSLAAYLHTLGLGVGAKMHIASAA